MFVDAHCHLEMEAFDKDRGEVIAKSLAEDLDYMLTVGTEERYFEKVIDLIERYPALYGAIGIHPHNSGDFTDGLARRIRGFLSHERIVAYGEIGLDFFRDYAPRKTQREAFRRQIDLALSAGLPIIIHSRDARDETISILQEFRTDHWEGVIHCYSYGLETARRFLDMGFHLSIPGTITYKNAGPLAEVVGYAPIQRLLSETDAPFLTPLPHRGKRNAPYMVKLTVTRMAEIKSISVEDLASSLCRNFVNLFLRDPPQAIREEENETGHYHRRYAGRKLP
jgi:TatD DNase family protein